MDLDEATEILENFETAGYSRWKWKMAKERVSQE